MKRLFILITMLFLTVGCSPERGVFTNLEERVNSNEQTLIALKEKIVVLEESRGGHNMSMDMMDMDMMMEMEERRQTVKELEEKVSNLSDRVNKLECELRQSQSNSFLIHCD